MQKENEGVPERAKEQVPVGLSRDPNKFLNFSISSLLNKFQQVCKEHVNKKKSNYEGQKNGDEGQNDAQVLKTYSSDTMTRNMG